MLKIFIIIYYNHQYDNVTIFYMIHLIYGENLTVIEDEISLITESFKNIPFEKVKQSVSIDELFTLCSSIDMFSQKRMVN